ncbi:hypothetical protein H2248_011312 [Termitomyces sp. 'cryptogamus']|nr:hypothetical protein H2248_011312 [Termitomyces sp. 'cryptogamus']
MRVFNKMNPRRQFAPSLLCRMSSVFLKIPRQIFSDPLPPPPTWSRLTDSSLRSVISTTSSSLQWKNVKDTSKLRYLLRGLQHGFCFQKQKIFWSMNEIAKPNLPPNEYLENLLAPVARVFNQLRDQDLSPIEYKAFKLDENIFGVTFKSAVLDSRLIGPPVILALVSGFCSFKIIHNSIPSQPDDLLGLEGDISSFAAHVLSQVIDLNSVASPCAIIMTNFRDLMIFSPPTRDDPQPSYEKVSTTQFSLALQVISTACIYGTLPSDFWIQIPDPDIGMNTNLVLPEGPPRDPDRPLLTDEEVFATHKHQSDFDIATLVRDQTRALQFFRWQDHIQRRFSKIVAPNDTLNAVANTLNFMRPPLQPIYSFDASELPADTIVHLKETQRQSPLKAAGLMEYFMLSKSFFTVKILDVIAEVSQSGICTVYRCHITSIDGCSMTPSPSLCLKLFDDRFQRFRDQIEEKLTTSIMKIYPGGLIRSAWLNLWSSTRFLLTTNFDQCKDQ